MQADATIYLVAWHGERIGNGFDGYRVFALDRREARLQLLGHWAGKGGEVYRAFKAWGVSGGFDVLVEQHELRRRCAVADKAALPTAVASACAAGR